MSSQNGIYELCLSPMDRKKKHYFSILERYENEFNNFKVHKPGLLQEKNILIISDAKITNKKLAGFLFELYASLEAVGIIINEAYMITVNNMGDKEYIKELISKLPKIKYFLMIGNLPCYNAVVKWIKIEMGIRGNYKSENKVFGSNKMLPLCLEINRQCRGVNYCCPNDFPKNIAFLHFVLKDDQISCSSNATKYYAPHVFIPSLDFGEIDYIQRLEDKLSEISGKLKYDKRIEIFIITFENYLKNELSDEIASKMYVAAVKWKSQIKCGIAEITLNAANKRIVSCVALQYDDKLDAVKIKEYLHLCNKCDDLRLKEEAVAYLPQQIKLAHISLKNIRNNYGEFEFLRKRKLSESDIFNNSTDTIYLHPKIKQRNYIINNENEDFLLI